MEPGRITRRGRTVRAGATTWVYEQTAPTPSYLTTVQVGRYQQLTLEAGPVPQTVYAPARLVASAVTYFAGGPVVHLAHGHGDKALLSLGVRATGPLLVFAGTSGNDVDRDSDSARVTLAVLGALCIPAAIVIDAAAIAREEEPRETGAAPRPSVALSPWIEPRRGGGGISLAGSL